MHATYKMLLEMMDASERKRFWILMIISLVLSAIEAVSVVSILPFLQLLADPGLIDEQPLLSAAFNWFGFTDVTSFQIAVGIAVFVVTIFGLGMKTLTVWMTTRFAMMRSYSFSARLLQAYLHQPYEWFLSRHTSELGTAILTEVDRVVRQSLLPAVRLIPETFSVLWLVLALCVLEPWIALSGAGLLGGVYALVFLAVRRKLSRLGDIEMSANRARFHVVQESTGGVKELKIMGLEFGFLEQFRHSAFRQARVQTTAQVIAALPRYTLEAVAFGGMILLVLILLVRTEDGITALIPTLGLIAAIFMRMIPALQQLYLKAAVLKNSRPVLEKIHRDLTGLTVRDSDAVDRSAIAHHPLTRTLELKDIHYSYPGTDRSALNGLNLSIEANTSVGIVGGTGAGKTTLIDIILGLLEPASGEMRIDDVTIDDETRHSWQKTLGYVPQTIFLTDGSVAQNIAFGVPADKIDMARVEQAARTAALHEFVMTELTDGYQTLVGERGARLSGGQRQRVGIARALYLNPSTLIFDEATSALDTLTEAAVMEAMDAIAGQKTIVMIAHRLSTVRNCDVIFFLEHGRVAASGNFDTLVETSDAFRRMAAGSS